MDSAERPRLYDVDGHPLRLRHEPCGPDRADEGDGGLRVLAESGGHVVASLRAQFADRGRFAFEPILDIPLPDACRAEIIVFSRLVVDASCAAHVRPIVEALVGQAFRLSWPLGYRAALFIAAESLAPVYARLAGAELVSEPRRHPVTGQSVQALMLAPLSPRQRRLRAAIGLSPQVRQRAASTAYLEDLLAIQGRAPSGRPDRPASAQATSA